MISPRVVSLLILIGFCSGCSDGINRGGKVTGNVTIDGKPVTAGEVHIFGNDGIHSMVGKIRLNGTYEILEPPLGPCSITVVTSTYKDIPSQKSASKFVDYTDPSTGEWPVYVKTPAKYETKETANLQFEIKKGTNTFDLILKSD